mmetsp:Transcript_17394/g.46348  ORF Transcript_17394/g.46348 Transcript_17394/m.46348 type:complete len:438 (-) Transcript_17394:656-1969(-)
MLDGHLEPLGLSEVLLPELLLTESLDLLLPLLELLLLPRVELCLHLLVKLLPLFLELDNLLSLCLLALLLTIGSCSCLALLGYVDGEGRLRGLGRGGVEELDGHHLHSLVHELLLDLLLGLLELLVLLAGLVGLHFLLPLAQSLLRLLLQLRLLVLRRGGEERFQRGGALALALPGRHLGLVLRSEHGEHRLRLLRHVAEVDQSVLPDLHLLALLQERQVSACLLEALVVRLILGLELLGLLVVGDLVLLWNSRPHLPDLLAELARGHRHALLFVLLQDLGHHLSPVEREGRLGLLRGVGELRTGELLELLRAVHDHLLVLEVLVLLRAPVHSELLVELLLHLRCTLAVLSFSCLAKFVPVLRDLRAHILERVAAGRLYLLHDLLPDLGRMDHVARLGPLRDVRILDFAKVLLEKHTHACLAAPVDLGVPILVDLDL